MNKVVWRVIWIGVDHQITLTIKKHDAVKGRHGEFF